MIPASIGFVFAAEPIVSMLYFHGEYGWRDVQNTALTLQAFALSIPAVALVRLQTSVFFSLKDSSTPVKISLVSIVVTGILGWWLSQSLEIFGLALGLVAGTWFQFMLLLLFLRKAARTSQKFLSSAFNINLFDCFWRDVNFHLAVWATGVMGAGTVSPSKLDSICWLNGRFYLDLLNIASAFQGRACC